MDKLNLDLNDLEVDSFQTDPEQEEQQGTVQGNLDTSTCDDEVTYDGGYSCNNPPCYQTSVRCETDEVICTVGDLCV